MDKGSVPSEPAVPGSNLPDDFIKEYQNTLLIYRNKITAGKQKSQEDYDKTVFTLSGGALGISFTFIEKFLPDIAKTVNSEVLTYSWYAWCISLICVLLSYYLSERYHGEIIKKIDDNIVNNPLGANNIICKIDHKLLSISNFLSGAFFVLGVLLISVFINLNI